MGWLPFVAAVVMGQGGASLDEATKKPDQVARVDPSLGEPVQVEDVEVFGRRGAALTPPEIELDGADIDAMDAWSIDDVLKRMDETLAIGGQPLVLINGRPTPNVSAYTGFPPDALVRAEVLPPAAAGLYGAAPGQRVVNLVLQRQFSSYDGRVVGSRPTQGGTSTLSGDLRRSGIAGRNTHQLGLRASRDTALRARERDRALVTDGPEADRVTLRPQSDVISANLSLTRGLGDWSGVFGLNGQTQDSRSVAQVGVGVVESRRRSNSLGVSGGASGNLIGWLVQTNLNGQIVRNREDGLQDMTSDTLSLGLTGSGQRSLIELPSGPVTANVTANFQGSRSTVERNQDKTIRSFQTNSARGALTIPLSRSGGAGWADRLGDVAATFGAGMRESGGGSGEDVSAGLTWTPRRGVRLNGEWAVSTDSVPDIQRSEPQYYGTPIVVFDFRTGEAVEVLPIRGGNPDLTPPESERWTASASLGPFTSWKLSGNLGYTRAEFTNGIGSLPELTEDVEAAFPDRFHRDVDGRLVSIDYRPLNLSSTLTESLNTGLNFNLPRPAGAVGQEATIMRVALNHSLQLSNVARLRAGLPEMDRLKGDGGGLSRQNASVLVDARRGRWGANISARWQEGYRTRRIGGQDGPDDLVMAPFTTVDLRFNFQMMSSRSKSDDEAGNPPRRRSEGLQLNLDISNLFDARREARRGDGSPAQGYGRDMQDPLGRTVRLTLQRRF
jgi:hypothetical protein